MVRPSLGLMFVAASLLLPATDRVSAGLERAIRHFDGHVVDPARYPHTQDGFQRYLTDSGVKAFSAVELTRPHHPDVARQFGYTNFLPSQAWWPRGAALALLAEKLRAEAGTPVTVRNWWRPAEYNRHPRVGGARSSDHLTAHSLDLDYPTAAAQRRAEKYLLALDEKEPWLALSLGLGARTTHIGLQSPAGHRTWFYGGHRPELGATSRGPVPDVTTHRSSEPPRNPRRTRRANRTLR